MDWKRYAVAVLLFNLLGLLAVYVLQRAQGVLPLNPQDFAGVTPDLAFNTAASFTTQHQLAVLRRRDDDELPHPDGGADGAELRLGRRRHRRRRRPDPRAARSIAPRRSATSGSTSPAARSTSCCPSPSSLALLLVSQGVIQNLSGYVTRDQLAEGAGQQILPMGPAASQIAIKQLGTNGGGFFNANSAHPFENPTPLSNFLEMLAILVISGALCYTFGKMVGDTRQGWALFAAMSVIFLAVPSSPASNEQAGNPLLTQLGVDQVATDTPGRRQHGGQGGPLRHRRLGPLGHRHDRRPPTAPSTRCTTASRRSAAWSRCSTCSSARSSSAASAPASTGC